MEPYRPTRLRRELEITEVVSVHYFEYSSRYVFEGERHPFWEFLYVDKGEVLVTAGKETRRLRRGDLIFHQPDEFHTVAADGVCAPNLAVISFVCASPSMSFFENKVLFTAVLAWLCAQVLKVLLTLVLSKKLNIERLWGAGGMPSAHSSMVCALTISLARVDGVNSPLFALAVIYAFVTMYDAMGVRREAGVHAKLLNKYLNQIENQNADVDGDGIPDKEVDEIELKEFIGHTPLEVLGGVLLGILVGVTVPM